MKGLWKRSGAVTLLLSAALLFSTMGGVALADEPQAVAAKSAVFSVAMFDDFYMHSDVHQQAYLTYLVREYAPESEAEWKEAFAQRNKVTEEMKDKIETITLENKPDFQVKTGTAPNSNIASGGKIFIADKTVGLSASDDKELQEVKARMELQEEFAGAVENQDADAIRAVLPRLLEDYKDRTARLPEMAENMKIKISEGADASGE
ncbi:hypothetical protein DCCM_4833 [Desulfocucumis palustris]|uniref:Uncharacterized protein n=1 Tax=Desulfocucumis palustris TaxID=1898651 RepID=A0A2L2XI97_9FIRM|nr:hypothetical protein [Desulfocucumis palustris]GBF35704.1 hypothetical protein DCCM_4833 [Desulfocucumis palustris]